MGKAKIFITGGTGYIGSSIIKKLIDNEFDVTVLTRNSINKNIPENCNVVTGDALDCRTYKDFISPCDTFIHLVGVAHPGPQKYKQFKTIDLVSIEEAVKATEYSGVSNFIYLSVANPAPIMKEYIKVRLRGESLLRSTGMNCSFVRPWYVIGPGRYWPLIFLPGYKVMEIIPITKNFVSRLGFVNIQQVTNCIFYAVNNPPEKIKFYNVPDIRKFKQA